MCMRITKGYKGTGTKRVEAWKIFILRSNGRLYSQYFLSRGPFKRRHWSGRSGRPGFHAYKTRREAISHAIWEAEVVRKVYLKGLLGESERHYTARYLWVN